VEPAEQLVCHAPAHVQADTSSARDRDGDGDGQVHNRPSLCSCVKKTQLPSKL
jgi:hypothetical protein